MMSLSDAQKLQEAWRTGTIAIGDRFLSEARVEHTLANVGTDAMGRPLLSVIEVPEKIKIDLTVAVESETKRVMCCPECGRVASIAPWVSRPICVHAWTDGIPEVWDGDDDDGQGRTIEQAPNEDFRTPGPKTWTEMLPYVVTSLLMALCDLCGHEWSEHKSIPRN